MWKHCHQKWKSVHRGPSKCQIHHELLDGYRWRSYLAQSSFAPLCRQPPLLTDAPKLARYKKIRIRCWVCRTTIWSMQTIHWCSELTQRRCERNKVKKARNVQRQHSCFDVQKAHSKSRSENVEDLSTRNSLFTSHLWMTLKIYMYIINRYASPVCSGHNAKSYLNNHTFQRQFKTSNQVTTRSLWFL